MHIEQLRFGILGFGDHARRKKLPAFRASKQAILAAVGTRGSKRAAELTKELPESRIYDSYEQLIADPEIDCIYIGLPNHLHKEWSIKALTAGKHVLCDKPIALCEQDALEMRAAAKEADKKLREAFVYRFHPQHAAVRKRIAEGTIGEIRLFETHFHFSLDDYSNIRLQAEHGGGGLLDVGCYTVDASRFLLDKEPRSVSATWHIGEKSRVDESCFVQLRYADGTAAHLSFGCRFGWSNFYSLYGTKGRMTLSSSYTIPHNKPAMLEVELLAEKPQTIRIEPVNQYLLELESFCDWVLGKEVEPWTLGDGVENMRILDAIRKASENNCEVEL